jgi:hypothetical protein
VYVLLTPCSIVDFFKEMPQFCIKVAHILTGLYGSDWEKRLEVCYAVSVLSCSKIHLRIEHVLTSYLINALVLCSVEGTASECCPFKLAKQVKLYLLLLLLV